jgi:hypothetical protein
VLILVLPLLSLSSFAVTFLSCFLLPLDHRAEYAKCKATIFENTEEGELLFLMLSGNFDKMADYYVDLDGKLTKQEKLELIKRRLTYVVNKNE